MAYSKIVPFGDVCLDHAHPLSNGLIGWWPLAGNGRDMLDHNPAAFTLSTTVLTNAGPATGYTGSSFATLPNPPALTTVLTASAWVFPINLNMGSAGGGVGGTIMESNTDGGSNGWNLGCEYSSSKLWFWPAGGADVRSSGTIPLNRWTHVCIVAVGVSVQMYLNGTLDSSLTMTAATQTSTYFRFGHQSHCCGFLIGNLRDLRLYNRALNAAEVNRLYLEPYANLRAKKKNMVSRHNLMFARTHAEGASDGS